MFLAFALKKPKATDIVFSSGTACKSTHVQGSFPEIRSGTTTWDGGGQQAGEGGGGGTLKINLRVHIYKSKRTEQKS